MKNTFPTITNMSEFKNYVINCDDGQLIGLAIQADKALSVGCCYNGLLHNVWMQVCMNEKEVGVRATLKICYAVAEEVMKRVANGTLSYDEYTIHAKMMEEKYRD